mgnify:CR=1 FL=1
MQWSCLYYMVVNLVLFCVMLGDKLAAKKHRRRAPEAGLFMLALLGGGWGGLLGMLFAHHKTRKPRFWLIFALAVLLHSALLYLLVNK